MHITFLCYWGMMSLINGVFDIVKFIDMMVHLPAGVSIFSSKAGFAYNFGSSIMLGGPLSLVLGAIFAYTLYSNHDTPEAQNSNLNGGGGYGGTRSSTTQNFNAFAGEGQRLGSA